MTYPRSFLMLMLLFLTGVLYGQVDTTQISQDTLPKHRASRHLVSSTPAENVVVATPAKKDTLNLHDPKKAALLSLIPGLGQIYNKKWWKLPIIYAGLGVTGYFAVANGKEAIRSRNEFFFRQYGATEYYDPKWDGYDNNSVLNDKNYYLRNMEICIGVFTILYALNIIDALVDAHLFYFDVSDDLSFRITPCMDNNAPFKAFSAGIAFKFSFK